MEKARVDVSVELENRISPSAGAEDARQDNMTKAKIAVQTVQHALTGIEAVASVTPYLPKAEQETLLTKHYVLAQYRGNSRKLAGRLFVLRKKGMIA